MAEIPAVPDKLLEAELTGKPITFTLGETAYELPRPFPMTAWIRLLMAAQESGEPDAQWFVVNLASQAQDVVCRLTGLKPEALAGLPEPELTALLDAVAEQLGEELADASPFSPARAAAATIHRAGKLAGKLRKPGAEAGGRH